MHDWNLPSLPQLCAMKDRYQQAQEKNQMAQKKTMTVTLMKRFEEMVDSMFESVAAEAAAVDAVQKRRVEVAVKKELGIYDLYVQLLQHETAVSEIKQKLKEWEDTKHIGGAWQSKLSHLIDMRLGGDEALPSTQINRAKQKIKDEMLFCTMPDEVKVIMAKIPELVKDIAKTLPKVTAKEIAAAESDE